MRLRSSPAARPRDQRQSTGSAMAKDHPKRGLHFFQPKPHDAPRNSDWIDDGRFRHSPHEREERLLQGPIAKEILPALPGRSLVSNYTPPRAP